MILVSFGFGGPRGGFYSDIRRNQSEERYELSADIGATEGLGVNNVSVSGDVLPRQTDAAPLRLHQQVALWCA